MILLIGIVIIAFVLVILILIFIGLNKYNESVPSPSYPIYRTKIFMPDIIKYTYIGMPLDEFEELRIPAKIEKNKDVGSFSEYDGNPDAMLRIIKAAPGEYNHYYIKFIQSSKAALYSPSDANKKHSTELPYKPIFDCMSLVSIEADADMKGLNKNERKILVSEYIKEINNKIGELPLKGMWIDKQIKGKNILRPSLIWHNENFDIVLILCTNKKCKDTIYWGIYADSYFEACLGRFLCNYNSCREGDAGWLYNKREIRNAFLKSDLVDIKDIDMLSWFEPPKKCKVRK
jgi:hypothetical protein